MWDFQPTFKTYITFETFVTEKNSNRLLYVVNLENKQNIRIGRGHDSDIRITDISVSRFHALIKKEKNGSFSIEDNNSKFGTLVLIQSPMMKVLKDSPLPIQIGRSLFTFTVKKPFNFFACLCGSNKVDKDKSYQILNAKHIDFEKCNYIKIQNDEDNEEEGLNNSSHTNKNQDINTPMENKNEVSQQGYFKVVENQNNNEGSPDNLFILENGEIEIYPHNMINLNSPIVLGDSPHKKNYLDRAKTNLDTVSGQMNVMQSIKERLRNDLESLRRVKLYKLS